MDEWVSYRPSGQYCPGMPGKGDVDYYTFTPNPLSTDLKIKMDAELASLLSTAHRLLGQLEGMSGFLPNIAAVNSIILQKEAILSCQIDGTNAPLYDVLDTSLKTDQTTAPIRSCVSAMHLGLEKIKAVQYKNALLCDIHKKLTLKGDSEEQGKFRTEQMFIGKIRVTTNYPFTYNPTAPTQLLSALRDLEKFIRRDDDIDVLIKAALAHYQFETIHPFMSGNGLVGRILPYLILADKKILTSPLLCLSHYLNLHRVEYIDRMSTLRRQCDYEQWIKFYIRAISFAANDSLEGIKNGYRSGKRILPRLGKAVNL